MNEIKTLSLFAGAGGMDMGFERNNFKVVWANDIDIDACNTYKLWSPNTEIINCDISRLDVRTMPDEVEVVLGGFPCQGFSLAGPRKLDDKRNTLYQHFVKVVEEKQPLAFIAENVKGLLTLGNGTIIEAIKADFIDKGFKVDNYLVNAADYGVPQERWRVILVGLRSDIDAHFSLPEPIRERTSLAKAIGALEPPSPDEVCSSPYSSRYMSRNRRRDWQETSFTIPAMAKQVPLHPSSPCMTKVDNDRWVFGEGVTRRLSWREAAAIQTFPLGMEFVGDLTSKYRQIGNAVPVRLAEAFSKQLQCALENKCNGGKHGKKHS